MSGTEIADALSASRSRAIAALGKAYVRRADEPDDELFRGLMHSMGLDDDVAISFLLHAWAILREQREQAPGEQAKVEHGVTVKPATDAQWKYLRDLADEKGKVAPEGPLTQAQASQVIEQLKAGTYKPDEWEQPF